MNSENASCAIIATYNGEQWIEECLRTLLEGTVVPTIYLVDNDSTDLTIPVVKSFPQVILTESKTNLGFGAANNLALREAYKAGHEYFFLVNQDTRVERNTVEELVRQVEATDHKAIISPIHFNGSGDNLDKVFGSVLRKSQSKFADHRVLLEDLKSGDMKERYEVKIVNAAFWMLSRKTLEFVGVFHPFFFHYGEDTNYWDRARFLGFKMIVAGKSCAFHHKIYRSRRHQSATNFFEKELLKIKLDPNKVRGGIYIVFAFFSGLEIVLLNRQFRKIYSYVLACQKIYSAVCRKVKQEKVDLGISGSLTH